MPNPFEKRRVTQAEREEILRKARQEWDAIGEHQVIFGNRTDEDHLRAVDATLEVIGTEYVEPAPQTALEKQEFENRIVWEYHLSRLRIPIPGSELTGIKAIDEMVKANNDREMAKFLQPARDAESALSKMIEETVARVLRKASGESSLPSSGLRTRPVASREGIMPIVKAAAEFSENTDLTRFLNAFSEDNQSAMRQIVRELEAA